MSALPERYQRYAQHGQPTIRHGEIELHADRDPVVYVPDAYGQMVPMRRSQMPVYEQPAAPRDLTPQPLFDPLAQRMIGGGVGGGVLLWGGGKFLVGLGDALSALSGSGLLLLFLALAGVRAFGGGRRGSTHIEVHQHARFGKNQVTM